MKIQFAMKYLTLFIALLWAFMGRSQGTIESCRAMGLYFCTECEDSGFQCELCASGYTLTSNKTGCLKCTDPNCMKCSINTADTTKTDCEMCTAGYYLKDADRTCVSCDITNCNTCHMGNDGVAICDQCDSSYYTVNGSECAACSTHCSKCSNHTSCDTCVTGYMMKSSCDECPTNCASCTLEQAADGKCTKCVTGYAVDSSTGKCAACSDMANCEECNVNTGSVTCTGCKLGFVLDQGTCYACSSVDNCEVCDVSTNTVSCTGCYMGFVLDEGKCYDCSKEIVHCLACSKAESTFTCHLCLPGYYLSQGVCNPCSESCTRCRVDSEGITSCTACIDGYVLNNGVCKVCPASCAICTVDAEGVTSCSTCTDGYILENGDCTACPNNCAKCTESSTTPGLLICDTCQSQFTLNEYSCGACPANCAKCSAKGNITICDTCDEGYYMGSDNVCQKCFTNCATCTSGKTCSQCVTGKGTPADNATCTDCAILTEISNCATCVGATSETAAKCVSCTSGYTISDDGKKCISTANFGSECVGASFKPPSCSVCQEGVGAKLVSDKCLVNCYTCGNLTNNVPISNVTECNSQGNEYPDKSPCEYGCYIAIKYSDNQMIFASRGCVVNSTCLSDNVEQCSNTGPSQNCFKCCDSGEFCNGDYWDPSSAPVSHVIGIITTLVTILAAYVTN